MIRRISKRGRERRRQSKLEAKKLREPKQGRAVEPWVIESASSFVSEEAANEKVAALEEANVRPDGEDIVGQDAKKVITSLDSPTVALLTIDPGHCKFEFNEFQANDATASLPIGQVLTDILSMLHSETLRNKSYGCVMQANGCMHHDDGTTVGDALSSDNVSTINRVWLALPKTSDLSPSEWHALAREILLDDQIASMLQRNGYAPHDWRQSPDNSVWKSEHISTFSSSSAPDTKSVAVTPDATKDANSWNTKEVSRDENNAEQLDVVDMPLASEEEDIIPTPMPEIHDRRAENISTEESVAASTTSPRTEDSSRSHDRQSSRPPDPPTTYLGDLEEALPTAGIKDDASDNVFWSSCKIAWIKCLLATSVMGIFILAVLEVAEKSNISYLTGLAFDALLLLDCLLTAAAFSPFFAKPSLRHQRPLDDQVLRRMHPVQVFGTRLAASGLTATGAFLVTHILLYTEKPDRLATFLLLLTSCTVLLPAAFALLLILSAKQDDAMDHDDPLTEPLISVFETPQTNTRSRICFREDP